MREFARGRDCVQDRRTETSVNRAGTFGRLLTMEDSTRATVTEWFRLWNAHAIEELASLAGVGYVHHTMSGIELDITGFQTGFAQVLAAFPDMRYTIVHCVVGGDHAACYLRAEATHRGSFFGIEATGTVVEFRGCYHCRVADGLIAEDWDVFDLLTPLLRVGGVVSHS